MADQIVGIHDDLRLALRAFTEAVCQRLAGEAMPVASVQMMRYKADGSGQGEAHMTPAPSGLVAALQQEWELWAAFQNLRKAIDADSNASAFLYSDAIGNPMTGNESWILKMMVSRFVYDYLVALAGPSIAFVGSVFDELWREFGQAIDTGLANIAWWAPIYNAQWIDEPFTIKLGSSSTLVEPPAEVMAQLLAHRRLAAMIDAQAWLRVTNRIALKSAAVIDSPVRLARNVASAVRLISGGHAFARDITMLPLPGVPGVYGQFRGWFGLPPSWWGGAMSTLNEGIEPQIVKRVEQLKMLGESFDVVLDRYESSVAKLVPDEGLIDATIGLEALLVGGSSSSTEVTYRFALTGAWVLADAPSDRPSTYRLLSELYGRRSDIVHGNRGRNRDLPQNPEEVAIELLRKLLLKVMESGWSWEQWIDYRRRLVLGLESDGAAPDKADLQD